MAVAEHAAALERRRRKDEQEKRRKERIQARKAALDSIRDYDPKTGRTYYTRFEWAPLHNLHEESPFGAMRFTDTPMETSTDEHGGIVCRRPQDGGGRDSWITPCYSANILSLKIVSSDVGFPINVYGTVIARDSIDLKCVSLLSRDRHHPQLINSPDDELILTGPTRGLVLVDPIYVEMDVKVRGIKGDDDDDDDGKEEEDDDKDLSKGYLMIDGISRCWKRMAVERDSLDSKLSMVDMRFAIVNRAVEATVAVDLVQGEFVDGKITAQTPSIHNTSIVLYDSSSNSRPAAGISSSSSIHLSRSVVAVSLQQTLTVTVLVAGTDDEAATNDDERRRQRHTIQFNPAVNGRDLAEIACASFKMQVKVTWSVISYTLASLDGGVIRRCGLGCCHGSS